MTHYMINHTPDRTPAASVSGPLIIRGIFVPVILGVGAEIRKNSPIFIHTYSTNRDTLVVKFQKILQNDIHVYITSIQYIYIYISSAFKLSTIKRVIDK